MPERNLSRELENEVQELSDWLAMRHKVLRDAHPLFLPDEQTWRKDNKKRQEPPDSSDFTNTLTLILCHFTIIFILL